MKGKKKTNLILVYLKKWFHEHRANPYPTVEEKLDLAQQSSMTYGQVENWFNNARFFLRRQHDQLSKVVYRSIGVQCNPSTVHQGTITSQITDDEIQNDRRIKVLTSKNISPKIQAEEIFFEDTNKSIIVTSTCLNDEQMVETSFFLTKKNIIFKSFVFLVTFERFLFKI